MWGLTNIILFAHLENFVFQSRGDSGHRRSGNGNGMYYGTPFYGGYGYASPVPHPNMYATAYGAYPYYGNQQLVSWWGDTLCSVSSLGGYKVLVQ